MRYRLIAVDLDGTLLNEKKTVSPANAAALRRAAAAGVKIMISSGRIFPEAELCVRGLDSVSLISACNGADIFDLAARRGKGSRPLPPEALDGIVAILRDSPLFYSLYTHDTVIIEKGIPERFACYKAYIEGRFAHSVFVDDIRAPGPVVEGGVYKIYAMSPDKEATARVRAAIEGRLDVEVSSSYANNIEITARGVDKGSALAAIEREYGIPREEMIALGDSENDLPMLNYAGLPIAMGNAEPCVLKAAKAVTLRNDEDGVAAAIEKYAL
jgi:Cof subfamily protein (haloacid dehalogenase superfamily)